jgi:hypothetical protein
MGVAPKSVASFGVNRSQKYVANWSLLVVIGNAVLVDAPKGSRRNCEGAPETADTHLTKAAHSQVL